LTIPPATPTIYIAQAKEISIRPLVLIVSPFVFPSAIDAKMRPRPQCEIALLFRRAAAKKAAEPALCMPSAPPVSKHSQNVCNFDCCLKRLDRLGLASGFI
jgi:hypothetical protein